MKKRSKGFDRTSLVRSLSVLSSKIMKTVLSFSLLIFIVPLLTTLTIPNLLAQTAYETRGMEEKILFNIGDIQVKSVGETKRLASYTFANSKVSFRLTEGTFAWEISLSEPNEPHYNPGTLSLRLIRSVEQGIFSDPSGTPLTLEMAKEFLSPSDFEKVEAAADVAVRVLVDPEVSAKLPPEVVIRLQAIGGWKFTVGLPYRGLFSISMYSSLDGIGIHRQLNLSSGEEHLSFNWREGSNELEFHIPGPKGRYYSAKISNGKLIIGPIPKETDPEALKTSFMQQQDRLRQLRTYILALVGDEEAVYLSKVLDAIDKVKISEVEIKISEAMSGGGT